jgi:hypothetical protein
VNFTSGTPELTQNMNRKAVYSAHFYIAIISLNAEQNQHTHLNILFTKCVLHISALIQPFSWRTAITSQNHLLTVGLLNWLIIQHAIYHVCVFFPNYLQLLKEYCLVVVG